MVVVVGGGVMWALIIAMAIGTANYWWFWHTGTATNSSQASSRILYVLRYSSMAKVMVFILIIGHFTVRPAGIFPQKS